LRHEAQHVRLGRPSEWEAYMAEEVCWW
jgi:hypothetical protein